MDESPTSNRVRILAFGGLGLAVLVAVLLLVFGGFVGGGQDAGTTTQETYRPGAEDGPAPGDGQPAASSTPTVEATAGNEGSEPLDGHDHDEPFQPEQADINEVRQASIAFVEAWLLDADTDTRAEALDPIVIPRLRDAAALSDPANLPTGQPEGEPEVTMEQPNTATSLVTLSSGEVIHCDLMLHPDGWRVVTFSPAENSTQDPTTAPTQAPAEAPTGGDGGG